MPDSANIVVGAEGSVTVDGQDWCQSTITISVQRTKESITSSCDWSPSAKVVFERQKTTGMSYVVSFEFQFDKTKDPWPTFSKNDDVTATVKVYDTGLTISGAFTVDDFSLQNNGVKGIWTCSVSMTSQGPVSVT